MILYCCPDLLIQANFVIFISKQFSLVKNITKKQLHLKEPSNNLSFTIFVKKKINKHHKIMIFDKFDF